MSKIIAGSIDLTKIDKSRIVEGKNGAKYYNILIVCNDTKDQYGNDVSIQQSQEKEERERKDKKVYLGNGKTIYDKPSEAKPSSSGKTDNDDLPF